MYLLIPSGVTVGLKMYNLSLIKTWIFDVAIAVCRRRQCHVIETFQTPGIPVPGINQIYCKQCI